MGAVDDFAIAIAKADSASSRVWIYRSGRQGQAKRVIGAASEGAAQQSARFSYPKWGRRMACHPVDQAKRVTRVQKTGADINQTMSYRRFLEEYNFEVEARCPRGGVK